MPDLSLVKRRHTPVRRVLPTTVLVALAFFLASCSSSPSTTTTSTTTAPHLRAGASSAIESNWKTFFNGKTPAGRKIALLENGTRFSSLINSQASSSLAQTASATNVRVSNVSATTAQVHYNIAISGSTALSNQSGEAVYQAGIWKVSDASFCVLLSLENSKTAACPSS